MPSLTRDPTTCPARQTSAVPALPRARFAPKTASPISTGQAAKNPGVTKAETSSGPASCSRLATFVLAQAISRAWACGSSRV